MLVSEQMVGMHWMLYVELDHFFALVQVTCIIPLINSKKFKKFDFDLQLAYSDHLWY